MTKLSDVESAEFGRKSAPLARWYQERGFSNVYIHNDVKRHIEKLEADIEALQRRVEELENLSSQVYQVVGSLSSDAGMFDHPATTKALDNLSMAASGKPLPHADLLPFPAKPPHEARG